MWVSSIPQLRKGEWDWRVRVKGPLGPRPLGQVLWLRRCYNWPSLRVRLGSQESWVLVPVAADMHHDWVSPFCLSEPVFPSINSVTQPQTIPSQRSSWNLRWTEGPGNTFRDTAQERRDREPNHHILRPSSVDALGPSHPAADPGSVAPLGLLELSHSHFWCLSLSWLAPPHAPRVWPLTLPQFVYLTIPMVPSHGAQSCCLDLMTIFPLRAKPGVQA